MRKIKIYGLLTCVCLMMQSCLFNEDDIFDESSAQRAIASVNECQEILKGAANGWLLEYYTGEDGEYGGFNVLARFDGNNVIMLQISLQIITKLEKNLLPCIKLNHTREQN